MRLLLTICAYAVFLMMSPQTTCLAQTPEAAKEISPGSPIIIHSDSLEIDQKERSIVFRGKVKATSGDMVVDCRKMIVYYSDSETQEKPMAESRGIEKIVASGDVSITQPDGSVARAGKAVFFQKEEKVVLTGDPFVQQGLDSVEGHKITMFLGENRSIVEGSKKKRVKAKIFPKEEKGKE